MHQNHYFLLRIGRDTDTFLLDNASNSMVAFFERTEFTLPSEAFPIHELATFSELTFFESTTIRDLKSLIQYIQYLDSIYHMVENESFIKSFFTLSSSINAVS